MNYLFPSEKSPSLTLKEDPGPASQHHLSSFCHVYFYKQYHKGIFNTIILCVWGGVVLFILKEHFLIKKSTRSENSVVEKKNCHT